LSHSWTASPWASKKPRIRAGLPQPITSSRIGTRTLSALSLSTVRRAIGAMCLFSETAMVKPFRRLTCSSPAFAARPHSAPTVNARIAGAREAILDHGLAVPSSFVRVGEPDDPKFAKGIADKGRVDSVLCANDHVAALLLRSLERAGVRVPEDMRMVGFDDVRFATLLSVPLTTMHQPCREIAQVALLAMLDRIADPTTPPRGIAVSPSLVVRESCGAYLPQANNRGR
jgi:DNA-binding LacI/PurR family transcriptional regulator